MKIISAILCFSVLALAAAGNLRHFVLVQKKNKKCAMTHIFFKRDVIYE